MQLINNSRFPVQCTVTPTDPPFSGPIPGGGTQDLPLTSTVEGTNSNFGTVKASDIPPQATVTFTVVDSQLKVDISF